MICLFRDHRMGVFPDGDGVITRFQNIAAARNLYAFRVIGGHVLHGEPDGNGFGAARRNQAGFGELHQIRGRLFNAAVGIRRVKIDFNYVFSGGAAVVDDSHIKRDHAVRHGQRSHLLRKLGIGQAVAKGILHVSVVVQEILGIRRLPVFIAHIDALHIVDKGHGSVRRRVRREDGRRHIVHIGVTEVAKVVDVGRSSGKQVFQEDFRRASGRIDGPAQDFSQRGKARRAGAGRPDDRANLLILVHPAQFHGVVGVENYDDVVKVAADKLDQVLFLIGQLQIGLSRVKIGCVAVVLISSVKIAVVVPRLRQYAFRVGGSVCAVNDRPHIFGQVRALAAGTGQDNHRLIGKRFGGVHQFICIAVHGRFRQRPVLLSDGRGCPFAGRRTGSHVIGIHRRQVRVGGETGGLKPFQNPRVSGGVGRTGTGAAVNRVGGRPAENVQLRVFLQRKRQGVVLIFQQDKALLADFPNGLPAVLKRLRRQFRRVRVHNHRQI